MASADTGLRTRIRTSLLGLRWQVREAAGGAEAIAQLEETAAEALLMDSWLPDLDVSEFASQMRLLYPAMDLLRLDGGVQIEHGGARSPRRNELLHALREAHDDAPLERHRGLGARRRERSPQRSRVRGAAAAIGSSGCAASTRRRPEVAIPELVGQSHGDARAARI